MVAGKPIIGLAGGIGSGKTLVARILGESGCLVIDADEEVRSAYRDYRVKETLRHWWGKLIFSPDGEVDRSAVARKVFSRPDELRRLEGLLHPLVTEARDRTMRLRADDPQIVAFVWDIPLLFETDLQRQCDAVIFVDAPLEARLARVRESRGWEPADLEAREKMQMPLDIKRQSADYVVSNTAADADLVRVQVSDVLSRILAEAKTPTRSQREGQQA